MTLKARLILVATSAVAGVLIVASVVVYLSTAAGVRGEIDDALRHQAAAVASGTTMSTGPVGPPSDGQVVDASGGVTPLSPDSLTLPLVGRAAAVARGQATPFFSDLRLGSDHLRLYVGPAGPGRAVEVAQSLGRVDSLLGRLRRVLVSVSATGVVVALGVGWAVAGVALRPVRRLQAATREFASTASAGGFVPVQGSDELAHLAASFNDMLVALRRSMAAQRQLVADASHELRTPLTSLRANVEYLVRDPGLEASRPVLEDVARELEDLAGLVSDLVELARLDADVAAQAVEAPSEVQLDQLVGAVVARAQRRWPDVVIEAKLTPTVVIGVPHQLERAVANLVDNAASWTGPDGPVVVEVGGGEVVVRDHGPGIAAADLPHVFERFYRSSSARRRPGSGLGLAIVQQAAVAAGGSVTAEVPADGGTRMRLRLPPVDGPA